MKRTLAAAATVVAGSAGVLGFAGTAMAVESPSLPTHLPPTQNMEQTTYHAVGTMHSLRHADGDMTAVEEAVQNTASEVRSTRSDRSTDSHVKPPSYKSDKLPPIGMGSGVESSLQNVGGLVPAQPKADAAQPVGGLIPHDLADGLPATQQRDDPVMALVEPTLKVIGQAGELAGGGSLGGVQNLNL